MVHLIPSHLDDADTLKAYLVTQLSDNELQNFKRAFEKGAKVHLKPMMHLQITQAPAKYTNASHAHMRSQENKAGNTKPFVVIDRDVVDKGAVWYVAGFADDFDVECNFAASKKVLMKALVHTEHLAISHVCWSEGNPPMGEELESLDENITPLRLDSEQSQPLGADDDEEELWGTDEVEVVAEHGEYETTTDPEVLSNMGSPSRKAVRLVPAIAQQENLISDWTWPENIREISTPDGGRQRLPARSIRLAARLDPQVPRLRYEWPEGSL
ncbi:hypothetical protein D6D19_01298 [Aureobasidium pullulans]|uniref:Uncharacterized protein n=1 Tax=Aureobasidium pullulans TaxID=5580 RepID=A0A4S9AJ25_AURPU|nr:hypothetical protein D6D19_01298 [Aureobasidium pullulans]THY27522.1 hypothetical protein D6D00_04821 [Aureobasidium pullulans]